MNIFIFLIAVAWCIFIVYWLFSAVGVKRNIRAQVWQSISLRIIIFIVIIAFLEISNMREFLGDYLQNLWLNSIGVALCVAGIAFAIWARIHLGRNWGMPMSLKEGADLITSGPYRYIRHPIYSGVLLAILGSALVEGLIWILVFLLMGAYFLYSARVEDRLMEQQFPDQYSQYKQKTKMLIPGIY